MAPLSFELLWLFALLSGKFSGHFSKLMLGLVVRFSKSQGGPFHHSELCDNSWGLTPLDSGAEVAWILLTWNILPLRWFCGELNFLYTATKAQKFRPCLRIHHNTSLLSKKNITVSIDKSRMAIIRCVRRNPNTAPISSSLGTLSSSLGTLRF